MWERMGAPKDKIVVGMATYGNFFFFFFEMLSNERIINN